MPELISEWKTNGLAVDQLSTFVNVLTGESAALQATAATGGSVDMNADFRTYTMPIVSGIARPTKVAENATKPVVESTPGLVTLTVDMWAQFHQMSRQLEATRAASSIVDGILSAAVGQFPIAYDIDVLTPMASGAGINAAVEYVAANPITSISSLLAPYDESIHAADAVVLTRAGVRKLGFALDSQNRLQTNGGAQALFGDLPVYVTKATGTELGAASLLAIVGPFGAGHWANADGVTVERMPQATVGGKGPGENIVNYRLEGAFGYGNGIDKIRTGVGFTPLIDAV